MNDTTLTRMRAHRANIERYSRLLATDLTDLERSYIHRRIAAEHAALTKLEAQRFARTVSATADPKVLVATRAVAQAGPPHDGR
jgi:hypothetical protein